MIYLITGQPGHGKTLRAMQLALEFQAQGREIYVSGIRGLKAAEAGFHELADPKQWQDLPDGSVIVLDECYTSFPRRMPGAKVPGYIEAMATHRHRGFDFILICQQAKQQMDGFLLGLVERHEHVRRRFGLQKSVILYWDKFTENTGNSDTKKLWPFPQEVMKRNLYESTVQDTTQRKVPWFFYALPVAVVILVLCVWEVHGFFAAKTKKPAHQSGQVDVSGLPLKASQASQFGGQNARPDDIAKWMTPRVPGQLWTAPAFDGQPVVSHPEIYCMALETGECNCITEQGTRYDVGLKVCRKLVYDGGYYNPTRPPDQQQQQQQQQQSGKDAGKGPSSDERPGGGDFTSSDPHGQRATDRPYTPPDWQQPFEVAPMKLQH